MSLNYICSPQDSFFYMFFLALLCHAAGFFHVPWSFIHILESKAEKLVWISSAI